MDTSGKRISDGTDNIWEAHDYAREKEYQAERAHIQKTLEKAKTVQTNFKINQHLFKSKFDFYKAEDSTLSLSKDISKTVDKLNKKINSIFYKIFSSKTIYLQFKKERKELLKAEKELRSLNSQIVQERKTYIALKTSLANYKESGDLNNLKESIKNYFEIKDLPNVRLLSELATALPPEEKVSLFEGHSDKITKSIKTYLEALPRELQTKEDIKPILSLFNELATALPPEEKVSLVKTQSDNMTTSIQRYLAALPNEPQKEDVKPILDLFNELATALPPEEKVSLFETQSDNMAKAIKTYLKALPNEPQREDVNPIRDLFSELIDASQAAIFFDAFLQLSIDDTDKATKLGQPLINIGVYVKPLIDLSQVIKNVTPIDSTFTKNKTIEEQRSAHEEAKEFLKNELKKMGSTINFVSHSNSKTPELKDVGEIDPNNLSLRVFSVNYIRNVQTAIKQDGQRVNDPPPEIIYGVASQFNTSEAPNRLTIKPGQAEKVYKVDKTQGPLAQMAYYAWLVELLNCGGNRGFNSLCYVLDKKTKAEVSHGYLNPSKENADDLIKQLKNNGQKIEYACVASMPKDGRKVVHEILVAAPDFSGKYPTVKDKVKQEEIQFLCALHAYRAQFQACLNLVPKEWEKIDDNPSVIFKATTPGLGSFNNNPSVVAKAFYYAALEYQNELENKGVKVELQIRSANARLDGVSDDDKERSLKMAQELGLVPRDS